MSKIEYAMIGLYNKLEEAIDDKETALMVAEERGEDRYPSDEAMVSGWRKALNEAEPFLSFQQKESNTDKKELDSKDGICHIEADITIGTAYIDGEEEEAPDDDDVEFSPIMPGVIKKKGIWYWVADIDINVGKVLNWPNGMVARLNYKPCDNFRAWYDGKFYDDYVPKCFCPESEGWGDYLFMIIDGDGNINKWDKDAFNKFVEKEMK